MNRSPGKNRSSGKKKSHRRRMSTFILAGVVIIAFMVMAGTQIVSLSKKNAELEARKERLEEMIESEELRQLELEDEEAYVKTVEFIEKKARSIGYVYSDEIIFKQEDE